MNLYCSEHHVTCFEEDCSGLWINLGKIKFNEDRIERCYLPLHKYGNDIKEIKLISEFKWLMYRSIYRGEK
jgi:hypothetical protein